MTRSRDDRDGLDGGGAADSEGLEGSERGDERPDAAFADAADDEDGSPLLPLLDAEAGPARPLSGHELLLLADRVERQFLAQHARPRSRLLSPKRLLLAGGLFAASAAAAVYGVGALRRAVEPASVKPMPSWSRPSLAEPSPPAERSDPEPRSSAAHQESSVIERPTEPSEPEPSEPEPSEPEPSEPEPAVRGAAPKSSDTAPSSASSPTRSSRSGASSRLNGTAASSRPNNTASSRQNNTVAADRLAAANSLRSRHRYREALALYLQLIEIDPDGMQASVARVAAAEMQLEQFGDVAGAERLYRDARTQGGELTAEAQFGLAQVSRARGDAPGERRALQDFLGRHPESPLAAAARRRLSTLGAR